MNNILFPTDFSDISYQAFEFALEYAKKNNSKIIVFHSYSETQLENDHIREAYEKFDVENFQKKKDVFPKFQELIEENEATDITIKYVVKKGKFLETLKTYISKKEDKIGLVVMGTAMNNSKLFELFTESNTIKIIDQVNKPVVVVPPKSIHKIPIKNVVFLVDYKENEKEALLSLIEQTQRFQAQLHVVHFDLAHGATIVPLMEKFKASLNLEDRSYLKFVTIDSIDLKSSLSSYCKEHGINMVCLVNHEKNFYQRLFSYSLAEDLINNMNIPIMTIYVKDEN